MPAPCRVLVLLALVAATVLLARAGGPAKAEREPLPAPQGKAPEPPDGEDAKTMTVARLTQEQARQANKVCYECHIDFQSEELSQEHEEHGIPCARCHGTSQAHMEDEVRKTPPDALFRGPAMKVFCLTCHAPREHAQGRMHAHEAEAARKAGKPERTCTACHGEHELIDTTEYQ